jgi:hypothetical protein
MDTASTLHPEDFGGELGEFSSPPEEGKTIDPKGGHALLEGRTHSSRSSRYWDSFDHTARREATKMSCGTFSPSFNAHEAHPLNCGIELNPASVYTLKYKQAGEDKHRYHEEKMSRPAMSRSKPWLTGTKSRPNTAP